MHREFGVLLIVFIYLILPGLACSDMSEDERAFLLMYFKEDEIQVISSTRNLKSVSRVAENVTVITKEEIERINAHSLAEVLNTVNGVQINFATASPGGSASAFIQGSAFSQVAILIDGVSLNNLGESAVDLGQIPVQNIEKIEIVNGPASSAWGSALGGVINIITKSPQDKGVNGIASVSYGWRNTEDSRVELSGKSGDAGFYISAGRIHSDGLRPMTDVAANNFYTKLTYDVSSSTDITSTLSYVNSKKGEGDLSELDLLSTLKTENLFSTLSVNSNLSRELSINASINAQRQRFTRNINQASTGEDLGTEITDDRRYGASAKLIWKPGDHTVVVGSDYDNGTERLHLTIDGEQQLRRLAFFANDTIKLGNLAIMSGLRYDDTSTNGSFTSPSIGATYLFAKNTIVRMNIARGFSIPPLDLTFGDSVFFLHNPHLVPENVWSYQIGAESAYLKYLWLKVSLFRHDLRDAIEAETFPDGTAMFVNAGRQRRQGFEVDAKTLPVYNTRLSAGMTFVDAKDLVTGEIVKDVPGILIMLL